MNVQQTVIHLAREKHAAIWTQGSDVGAQAQSAIRVGREWQRAVCEMFPGRFKQECVVAGDCGEKIDLVDSQDGVAYELKVSPNNTHFEFYRDVFKVWVQREIDGEPLKKLVFITLSAGAARLNRNFGTRVLQLTAKHGLAVEIAGI